MSDEDELSEPISVQMRLPANVLERLDVESKSTLISRNLLVRRCVLDHYGRGSLVSDERTNSTTNGRIVRGNEGNGNG